MSIGSEKNAANRPHKEDIDKRLGKKGTTPQKKSQKTPKKKIFGLLLLAAVSFIAVIIGVQFKEKHQLQAAIQTAIKVTHGEETLSTDTVHRVMPGDILHIEAAPLMNDRVLRFVYFWDDNEDSRIRTDAKNDSLDISVHFLPYESESPKPHTLTIAAEYPTNEVYPLSQYQIIIDSRIKVSCGGDTFTPYNENTVMPDDILCISAAPLMNGEDVSKIIYRWDGGTEETVTVSVKNEDESVEIMVPHLESAGLTHTLEIAGYYETSNIYSDGNTHPAYYEKFDLLLDCKDDITVMIDGQLLDDGDDYYTVKGGEKITVCASSVSGVNYIDYYFYDDSNNPKERNNSRFVKVTRVENPYNNPVNIPFPHGESNSKIYLNVFFSDENRQIRKELCFVYDNDIDTKGTGLYINDKRCFDKDVWVTEDAKITIKKYSSDRAASLLYKWIAYDEDGGIYDAFAGHFEKIEGSYESLEDEVPLFCYYGLYNTYLQYYVEYPDGTHSETEKVAFHISRAELEYEDSGTSVPITPDCKLPVKLGEGVRIHFYPDDVVEKSMFWAEIQDEDNTRDGPVSKYLVFNSGTWKESDECEMFANCQYSEGCFWGGRYKDEQMPLHFTICLTK